MSPSPTFDILGLGCVAVDDLLYLDSFPIPDTKAAVRGRQRQCGGLTGNALVAAARLGAHCAFAGTLGTDESSRFVLDTFKCEGIDTSVVRTMPDARPIRSTILVDQCQDTRTILFDLSGTVAASPDWPPEESIRTSRAIYVDHYGMEGMIRAARIARHAGIAVIADLERNEWPGFDELLGMVDHVIVNRAFAYKLTGCGEPEVAAAKLWNVGRSAVVVTCGAKGSWYIGAYKDKATHQKAFIVPVVDTTGCGDVFHGAYSAAWAKGMPLPQRVQLASAAAAIKASKLGGQQGSPRWEELMRFVGNGRCSHR